jgi:DMSO/TMAO reductase YedYZ molybdopterin-dependent catalytic subunit
MLNLVSSDALWGYSPLNLHVYLGLATLPLLIVHVLRRWERRPTLTSLVSRRSALRLIGLSVATVAGWRLLEQTAAVRASEGSRHPSGSKQAGSFSGNQFPTTIWLFDEVPSLTPATWRLEIRGRVSQPDSLSYPQLLALPSYQLQAVLDCTGGWWSEQVWQGIKVGDVLSARGVDPSAREASVISVTGHRWTFPLQELQVALLSTHVGGELLVPSHGYPVRLVAPGRRGFQWVKWVGAIEVL